MKRSLNDLLKVDFLAEAHRLGVRPKDWSSVEYLGGVRDAIRAQSILREKRYHDHAARRRLRSVIEQGLSILQLYEAENSPGEGL